MNSFNDVVQAFYVLFTSKHLTSLGGCSHYILIVKCCSFLVLFRNTHSAKYYLVDAPENHRTTEAVVRRRFVKKVFLKFLKNSQENTCVSVHFMVKFQAKDCKFVKKRFQHRCFPVKYTVHVN